MKFSNSVTDTAPQRIYESHISPVTLKNKVSELLCLRLV